MTSFPSFSIARLGFPVNSFVDAPCVNICNGLTAIEIVFSEDRVRHHFRGVEVGLGGRGWYHSMARLGLLIIFKLRTSILQRFRVSLMIFFVTETQTRVLTTRYSVHEMLLRKARAQNDNIISRRHQRKN